MFQHQAAINREDRIRKHRNMRARINRRKRTGQSVYVRSANGLSWVLVPRKKEWIDGIDVFWSVDLRGYFLKASYSSTTGETK